MSGLYPFCTHCYCVFDGGCLDGLDSVVDAAIVVSEEGRAHALKQSITKSQLDRQLRATGLPASAAFAPPRMQAVATETSLPRAARDLSFTVPITIVVVPLNDPPDFEIRIPRGSELAVEEDSSCITRSPPSSATFLTFLARPGGMSTAYACQLKGAAKGWEGHSAACCC